MALASAPSNIALIKYMGKHDPGSNLPANASLSLTLDGFRTYAEVKPRSGGSEWRQELPSLPRLPEGDRFARAQRPHVPELTDQGVRKLLLHLERVAHATAALFGEFGISAAPASGFEVRTANTFPASSGIASSASSFAALTLATAAALAADHENFARVFRENAEFRRALARISRQGSGSSCRSFEGPWVLWERESAAAFGTAMPEMADIVLLVGKGPKTVSSSEAHALVKTSPLWEGRVERVESRIRDLEAALGEGRSVDVSRIAWAELWEMHSLFHTCASPFTYWQPGTLQALQWLRPWMSEPDAPIVTMDAGPNVHVIVPAVQAPTWIERISAALPFEILADRQGGGASLL